MLSGVNSLQAMMDLMEQQRLQMLMTGKGPKGAKRKVFVRMAQLTGKIAPTKTPELSKLLQQTGLDKLHKLDLQKLDLLQDPSKAMTLIAQSGLAEKKINLLLKLGRSKGKDGKSGLEKLLEELKKKKYPFEGLKDEDLLDWAKKWLDDQEKEQQREDPSPHLSGNKDVKETKTNPNALSFKTTFDPSWILSESPLANDNQDNLQGDFKELKNQLAKCENVLQKVLEWHLKIQHPKKLKTPKQPVSIIQIKYAAGRLSSTIEKLTDFILSKNGGDKFISNLKKLKLNFLSVGEESGIQDTVALLMEYMIMGRDLYKKKPKKKKIT